MHDAKIRKYTLLNEIADGRGIVVFGGTADTAIPLCELKQAFSLESDLYNRSIPGLSVQTAAELYDTCVSPLHPDMVFLHIGEADREFFAENADAFDRKYRELTAHIRKLDKTCEIVILSLKNPAEEPGIQELNRHLKYIADAERCTYADIGMKRVWNPKETKEVASFLYAFNAWKEKRPVYDLVKILFCCDAVSTESSL